MKEALDIHMNIKTLVEKKQLSFVMMLMAINLMMIQLKIAVLILMVLTMIIMIIENYKLEH